MRKGEIITAGLFLVLSLIIIVECFRLGFGWEPQAGPQAGMVPFYLALLMGGCSAYVMYLGHSWVAEVDGSLGSELPVFCELVTRVENGASAALRPREFFFP